MFRALLLQKDDATGFRAALTDLPDEALDEHAADADVTVRVECSTLNFKDALALTNRSPVVRRWPMVPGIDCAGIVQDSRHPEFAAGDRVVLNGWGVGESHWGGLAQRARLKGDWLLRLPESVDSARAMAIGTAGYTAMLCALALRREGVTPEQGDVLVTGAAGGVGSVAIAILAGWGYRVVASTGRLSEEPYLKSLGAADVIDRSELSQPGKPLQRERWAGVVDAVGSHTLANACAQTKYRGTVTACGLAQGMDFPATVAPFILRGVKLIGIDSVMCPIAERRLAWDELARSLDPARLDEMTTRIGLSEAIDWAPRILGGQVRGRLVVDVDPGGHADKLLAMVQGKPAVLHAHASLAGAVDRIIAVTRPGARGDRVASRLREAGCTVAVCAQADRGMGHSLACAADHATACLPSAVVVMLGDMPFVQDGTIAKLVDAVHEPTDIAAPRFQGRRGHPVVFGAAHLPALSHLVGDRGAAELLARYPVKLIDVDDAGVLQDVDTPEDLNRGPSSQQR